MKSFESAGDVTDRLGSQAFIKSGMLIAVCISIYMYTCKSNVNGIDNQMSYILFDHVNRASLLCNGATR